MSPREYAPIVQKKAFASLLVLTLACGADDPAIGPGAAADGGVDSPSGEAGPDAALAAEPIYVIDLSAQYLNCFGGCKAAVSAQPVAKTLDNLDTLVLAMSVQGIVNRKGPRLYVVATPADAFWLQRATEAGKAWGWAAAHPQKKLTTASELASTFGAELKGSVRWTADVPATLDVATTAAGALGLAIVRESSPVAAAVLPTWPVQSDLVGKFKTKRDAYAFARATYLGKTRPGLIGYQLDGWPWTRLLQGADGSAVAAPNILARDYLIGEQAYVFDLSPWADVTPPDDGSQPLGSDLAELVATLDAAHAAVAGKELGTMWGFYPVDKYAVGVHSEPVSGEWTTARIISEHGVRLTGNGGQAYGLEAGNASFHKWGTFPNHAPRHASPTPSQLADLGYINQRLQNPGFDWNSLAGWTIDAQNRAIYAGSAAPGGHEYFLEFNGALNQSLYQTVPVAPQAGETWRLRAQYRLPQPASRAKLVLWGLGGGDEAAQVALTNADGQWHTAEVTLSPATSAHTAMRAQVYLDAAGPSVDLDELRLARVAPWSNDVAPLTFATFFEADYDMGTPIYATPVAVYPKVWTDQARGSFPVAWDFAPDTIDYYPGVMHYYFATATATDWFTVSDSGGGYVNPSYLSAADRALFIKSSRRAMSRTGESFMSFFLNGYAASPAPDVEAAWNALGPDGVIANQLSSPDHRMVGNVGWWAVDSNGWSYGGISEGDAAANLDKAYVARYGNAATGVRFLAGRNVYTGPDLASRMVAASRAFHPERDLTAVDPYTFGYLYRQWSGGANTSRASWLDDTLPRAAAPGASLAGSVRVRNDGWETWSASACKLGVVVSGSADATPSSPAGATVATFALPADASPGAAVDVAVTLAVPKNAGKYAISYDMSCGGWFESALNLEYHDALVVSP